VWENKYDNLTFAMKSFLISLQKYRYSVDFENDIDYNIFEMIVWGEEMGCMNEIASLAKEHGGIVETKVAIEHGISKAMLSKLCKEDKIHRVAQGQYILPDEMQDELLSISKRSEQIIFSHETALFLHGISDRTPFEHTITVPSNYTPSVVTKGACKIYYIKPELFSLGKTFLKTPAGNDVPAYDLERTICDIIRSRNKLGTETFLAALKQYAARPKKNLNRLNEYAKQLRVANVLRRYLEVLL
jgi:predicted transcriptional regulator of viral defense system